jgi:hypothetical protein
VSSGGEALSTTINGGFMEVVSGTLAITGPSGAVDLTLLGHYSTVDFKLSSDGAGGTLVTYPPSPVATAGNPVLAAHT